MANGVARCRDGNDSGSNFGAVLEGLHPLAIDVRLEDCAPALKQFFEERLASGIFTSPSVHQANSSPLMLAVAFGYAICPSFVSKPLQ